MKLSCLPVSIFSEFTEGRMSIGKWAEIAKNFGYDAIDISMIMLKNHTPVYVNQVSRQLQDNGMSITMATTYPDFTHPDALQRLREFDYLRRDIALCSELKIKYLRVLAGQAHPRTTRKEGVAWAVENLRKSVAIAEQYEVKLVYEDHAKPGAWDYVDFSHPTDIFLEVLEGIDDTDIGLNFDTGNIVSYGDDPIPVLKQVLGKVETVHVSDIGVWGEFSPVAIGTGIVPNREIFTLLKHNGFDGWLCIEEASGNGLSGIKKAADFVRKAWLNA
jgi:sugar phosphate isomerase/epimerase